MKLQKRTKRHLGRVLNLIRKDDQRGKHEYIPIILEKKHREQAREEIADFDMKEDIAFGDYRDERKAQRL